jgi:hypothetical protein
MSSTIETTNNIIHNKINCLKEIINIYYKYDIDVKLQYVNELKMIEEDYEMGSIKILSDYYWLMKNYKNCLENNINNTAKNKTEQEFFNDKKNYNNQKDRCFKEYQIFIRKENFSSKLDRLYFIFKNHINLLSKKDDNYSNKISFLKNLLYKYENNTINKNISYTYYDICSNCSNSMKIIPNLSKLICSNCGVTEDLCGTVFEDEQFYYQEGQRTKHGSYDPSKHCRFWVDRIQARETKEIPQKIIDDIKNIIKNNIKNVEDITCKVIRKFLRQIDNSSYNEHIPLIRKIITGITPPQLTDRELQLINIYFDKVIKIYDEIKPANKTNCFYHPYFIYKIIEHILKDSSPKRMHGILCCIHLQSRETLIKNDKIWKDICDKIDEITYIPTDRNKQYIYE